MSLDVIQEWTGEAVSLLENAAQEAMAAPNISDATKSEISSGLGVLQAANQALQTVKPGSSTDWLSIARDVLTALQQLSMLLRPFIPMLGPLAPVGMTVQLALGALTAVINAIPVHLPPVTQAAPHLVAPATG